MRFRHLGFAISLAATLAACTAGQTTAPSITQVNPLDPNYSKLQFAVGTANLFGSATPGLNIVATMRQPNGTSALGVDTPVIKGPFAFSIAAVAGGTFSADPYMTLVNNGPSLQETSSVPVLISGTPQTVVPGTPFCDGPGTCPGGVAPNTTTFGQSGGIFAMGLAPYNHIGTTGQAYSYQPYPQPFFNQQPHNVFIPWGGPPAFDPDGNGMGTRDGLVQLGSDSFGVPFFLGVGEGITAFDGVTPGTGTYSLSAQVSFLDSNGHTVSGTLSAMSTLSSVALLPTVTAPVVTPDAVGGASFTAVALPPGVTSEFVQIIDYGPGAGPCGAACGDTALTAPNCQGPKGPKFAPVYYTVLVTTAGSYLLGSLHGPNTASTGTTLTPSPSICTHTQNNAAVGVDAGDNFTVQVFGFDYPLYNAVASLFQATTPQAPPIGGTGPGGQSDITISIAQEQDYPAYGVQHPLNVGRKSFYRSLAPRTPSIHAAPEVYKKLGIPAPRW